MEYVFGILIAMFIIFGPWIFILIQHSNLKKLTQRVDVLQHLLSSSRQQTQPNEVPSSPAPSTPVPSTPVPSPKDFQRSSPNEVLSTEFSQQSSVNEVLSTEFFQQSSPNEVLSTEFFQQSSPNEVLSTEFFQQSSPNEVLSTEFKKRSSKEWEMFVGGKLLNRIGAIAIVIGALFFLKYAFDENWITEPMRVGIGVLSGATLLVLAARFYKRDMVVFAQGLIGAGFPILYISVWSTYSYYHLLPHTVSFVCMMLVTVLAAWHAVRYKSLFIGMMAVIGGMITPALLSTGVMNTTGLFTYIALLDLGLFAMVVVWKMWRTIGWTAIAGTLLWWMIWLVDMSTSEIIADFPAPIFFILLAICMTIAYDIVVHRNDTGSADMAQRIGIGLALFAFTCVLYAVLNNFALASWLVSFIIETLVFFTAVVVVMRMSDAVPTMKAMYASLAVLSFALIPAHYDVSGIEVALFRSLIAALCVFLLRPVSSPLPTVTASIIALFSLLSVLAQGNAWMMDGTYVYTLPWNGLPIALVACGIGLYSCGLVLAASHKASTELFHISLRVLAWITIGATAAKLSYDFSYNWLYADTIAGTDWQAYVSGVASVMAAFVVGLVLRNVGEWRDSVSASIAGAITQCVGVVAWLFVCIPFAPDSHFSPGMNIRVATALFMIAGLYLSLRTSKHVALLKPDAWKITFWLGIGLLSFVLLSAEAIWPLTIQMRSAYEQDAPRVAADILDKIHLVLSSVWIVYSILVVAVGFWRRRTAVRITGIGLLGISILKIFIYDLSFLEQPYRIVSFIALGMILLIASFGYQRYKHIILT